jgi:hypothetical protein
MVKSEAATTSYLNAHGSSSTNQLRNATIIKEAGGTPLLAAALPTTTTLWRKGF